MQPDVIIYIYIYTSNLLLQTLPILQGHMVIRVRAVHYKVQLCADDER